MTASARLRYWPTVPVPDLLLANRSSDTPAVASDSDLGVSRRTLAPGLVQWADAAPCVLRTTANWNRSSHLTVAAALTMRISHLDSALSLSHRTLSSLISTRRTSAATTHTVRNSTLPQLPHTAKYVRSQRSLILISCLLRKFPSHTR